MCVTEHEEANGPCITKQSVGRSWGLFAGLTRQEKKRQHCRTRQGGILPFSPSTRSSPCQPFISRERERGVIAGHTMNGLCKIWLSWQSMWPYSPGRQRGVGIKCVFWFFLFFGGGSRVCKGNRFQLVLSSSGLSFYSWSHVAFVVLPGIPMETGVCGGSRFNHESTQIHSLFLSLALCNTL